MSEILPCPEVLIPICPPGSELVTTLDDNGCPFYDCVTIYPPCPCGTLEFPIGKDHISNGSFIRVYVAGNQFDVNFRHDAIASIQTEQKFRTISKPLPASSIIPTKYTIYLGSTKTLEGSIRIVLSTRDGTILAQKYLNDHDDTIELSEIQIDECNFIETVDLSEKEIILNIYSVCDREKTTCCELPPTDISLSNKITTFCITIPTTTTTTTTGTP